MKKKKGFFQELRERNVWREVRAYLFGGAAIIPLVLLLQPIVGFSQNVSNIIFIIFFSLFPSVFLFAYHHGESRDTPWSKAERIGIPANILITLFLVIFFYNNNAIATETKTELIENLETGEIEEIEVVKKEYRKKIYLSFFENTSNDTTQNWLEYGIPYAINKDLRQDNYMTPNLFSKWSIKEKDDTYKYGDQISLATYREIAKEKNIPYFIIGSFKKVNDKFAISTNLWKTNTGKLIKERRFTDNNLFNLIDQISISIKEDLGLSTEYIENTEDLPISVYLTESLKAYKYFCTATDYNRNKYFVIFDQNQLQQEINLLNQAINIDNNFALAYDECIHRYDRMGNRKDSVEIYWKKVMQKIHKFQEQIQYGINYRYFTKQGKTEQAVRVLTNWAKKYPNIQDPHEYLASYYNEIGEKQKAIDAYKEALNIDKTDYDIYRNIASNYEDMYDFENAVRWFKKSANIYSKQTSDIQSICWIFKSVREMDSAKYYYNELLSRDPDNFYAHSRLFDIKKALSGDLDLNPDYLLDYAQNEWDSSNVEYYKRTKYWKTGQIKKHSHLEDSINNIYITGWIGLGIPEYDQFQKEHESFSKLAALGKKAKIDSQLIQKKEIISQILSSDKYGESVKGIIKTYQERFASIYLLEIFQKESQKEIDSVINYLKEQENKVTKASVRITFGDDNSYRIRLQAKSHALEGDYENAIAILEENKQLNSGNGYLLQLAKYYHKLGDYKKAEENFNIIFSTNPYHSKYNYYAALLYYDWGKTEKAKEKLDISLEKLENADEDYVLANKVKETAQEWGVEIPSN